MNEKPSSPSPEPAAEPAAGGCDVTVYRKHDRLLIILSGSLVLQHGDRVRARIHPLLTALEYKEADVYLRRLEFIDSSGLGILVGLQMTARKHKLDLRLLAPTPDQTRLFETTRLSSVFKIVSDPTAEKVLEELEKPALLLS